MILTAKLAQQIVNRTMTIIEKNINVMNNRGVIIGSGDSKRLGQLHEGALIVIKENKRVDITEENMDQYHNVKLGINLPIFLNQKIVGVIGITGIPGEIEKYGELVKMAAEVTLQQAYLTEQLQWEQRLMEELVSQMIHNDLDDYFYERMERLGFDLTIPRVTIILEWSSGEKDRNHQQIQQQLQSLLNKYRKKEELIASTSPFSFVILKPIQYQHGEWNRLLIVQELKEIVLHIKKSYKYQVKFSISDECQTIQEIARGYDLAKRTLKVGKIIHSEKEIYFYDDYIMPVMFSDIQPTMKSKLGVYHSIIQQDKKGELQETLDVYIDENGELNKIAERLYIHRNTLRYRLGRIHEISGKDPKNIKDLFELYISKLLYQFNLE
ncbi:sugar diacid recognition domain-containing protein [Heyndrickxia sp. NPDC080065]|uniref:sugar diacid recognition domain-containing protein n=1 Tax=Heyndrickxia sp. NPDC080065 TaxID=3390568 RepID=UPI003D0698E8